MKILYIIIYDNEDGSFCLRYTMSQNVINFIRNPKNTNLMGSLGFYSNNNIAELYIPDECTYESLGIHFPLTEESITHWRSLE